MDVEFWKAQARRIANRELTPEERETYLGKQEILTQVLHGWLVEHGLLSR